MAQRSELAVPLATVEAAARALAGRVVRTPLVRAPPFPGLPDSEVYLKLENLQWTGAFKLRGATNKILSLSPEEAARGVVAASAGNHAQGVAWAARAQGISATIVMPQNASPLKVSRTRALGARVVLHGADYEEAHEFSLRIASEEHRTYVHPFDDASVIAGQGTVGLEILEDLPNVRRIIVGVGGGGLLAGIAAAVRGRGSTADLVGIQPEGADTLRASLSEGRVVVGHRPATFADGLATRHVGDLALQILVAAGVRAFVADDRTIARATFLLLEQAKLLAEGAGAIPLAGALQHPELLADGPVVLVISGGNLDPFLLDRILFIGLAAEGRLLRLRAPLQDVPGALEQFLDIARTEAANVRHILHNRESPDRPPGEVTVQVELEVRDAEHGDQVVRAYQDRGRTVERISLGAAATAAVTSPPSRA
ncbi:MAG: threonine ammonia-lyase [Thermoplasmata archaeon]|jgi:threonine dehydratase|nr:threonine ammonia-lyase [Thermoplasmata archaeon]